MASSLIRFDLSLPHYFTYPPQPQVDTRAMIPRTEDGLYIRGEFGIKSDGAMRPISSHASTHLDVPYHFVPEGADLDATLNRRDSPADRPCLTRVVHLAGRSDLAGSFTRDGITYCETISAAELPPLETLRGYEALAVLSGFAALMEQERDGQFTPAEDGANHVPCFTPDAVARILASGVGLVALDSPTVEPQTGVSPLRYGSDVHRDLLGHSPPVLIVEGIGGGSLAAQVGFVPTEALLHVVPRRVNAKGADAAPSRVFLYFYRDDPRGTALRALHEVMRPEECYG